MTDQSINQDRPDQDPVEGKPDLQPSGGAEKPGEKAGEPSTGGQGSQGAGGPAGFGAGD